MCFIKSKSKTPSVPNVVEKDKVVRHQADASLTKSSPDGAGSTYGQNARINPIGLTDEMITNKKTLLGD